MKEKKEKGIGRFRRWLIHLFGGICKDETIPVTGITVVSDRAIKKYRTVIYTPEDRPKPTREDVYLRLKHQLIDGLPLKMTAHPNPINPAMEYVMEIDILDSSLAKNDDEKYGGGYER